MLGKATKQANRLTMTGVKQRFYGYAAMGASPTTQKRMRVVLANAGGIAKLGNVPLLPLPLQGSPPQIPGLSSHWRLLWSSLLRMLIVV